MESKGKELPFYNSNLKILLVQPVCVLFLSFFDIC
jgi:hypothetical protein